MRFDAGCLALRAGPWLWALCVGGSFLAGACGTDDKSSTERPDAGRDASAAAPEAAAPLPTTDAGRTDRDSGTSGLEGCGAVTTMGRCASSTRVELCVQATGGSMPARLNRYDCKPHESCDDTGGVARCVLTSECATGDSQCVDPRRLSTCVAGSWSTADCTSRCVPSTLGAACAPPGGSQTVSGKVQYEARLPNAELSDWAATPTSYPARHFAVLSYANGALFDATYTDDTGAFTLLGPATPTAADTLVVVAAGPDTKGKLAFAVANAGYPASASALREPFDDAPDPSVWSWSVSLESFSNADMLTISEASGSGAARVFETLHGVFNDMQTRYAPRDTQSVLVWVSPGTAWNCGACMATLPAELAGRTFLHQVWFDGSDTDRGYWSDAVTAHELGHYVMSGFAYPPAEGGPHYTGSPTNPGQAFSEGWATFFSSMHRDSPIYYDKQMTTFFWLDLGARSYGIDGLAWQRPAASAGLEQLIDENEVAAMLRATQLAVGDRQPMLKALAAERLRVPPFERGYTLRTWSDPEYPDVYEDSSESIPHLADFFDALRCDDAISAAALDLVTEPGTHYPYPSGSPLCR